MDFWQRARSFAEEAAKKSQEIVTSANLSEVISEASKRSKELAAEASKKSKEIAAEALKRADQITAQLPPAVASFVDSAQNGGGGGGESNVAASPADLEMFGVTDELRDFIKEITINTFQDFPIEDDMEMSDIPAVSNVRQDLTEWQERHAKIVLSTVKEISKLRYQLCPRMMKERKFWRIYFILVNSHVGPYEKRYMEDVKLKSAENVKDTEVKESAPGGISSENVLPKQQSKSAKTAASDQDLDVFLLGDEDSDGGDGGPDDGDDDGFEDDFDKI